MSVSAVTLTESVSGHMTLTGTEGRKPLFPFSPASGEGLDYLSGAEVLAKSSVAEEAIFCEILRCHISVCHISAPALSLRWLTDKRMLRNDYFLYFA